MRYQFTPASERALAAAAGWTNCTDQDELSVPAVLLGLLAEPECRGAMLLRQFSVDSAAVQRRFADLVAVDPPNPARASRFSSEWLACLRRAEELLMEYPRPLVLATEHLLLGIVATGGEVSEWLGEFGLHESELEAEVHRLAGHQPGPLSVGSWEVATLEFEEPDSLESPPEVANSDKAFAALRVMDAAANRAGEGLRVVEDYLRFVLEDRHLTTQCKEIRHDLTAALAGISSTDRHAARDTLADVGADVSLPDEQVRGSPRSVLEANFKRVEQSLRSLEEFLKMVAPPAAFAMERLRYRVYTLERAAGITQDSAERLGDARLYVLVDGCSNEQSLGQLVESLVSAGASIVQLRDKRLSDRALAARARLVGKLTRGTSTLFIMNDRPDLAAISGADGVHLGQEELSVREARQVLGTGKLVGVSTHSLEQAQRAVLDGADYIGVGPIFPSGTKQFMEFPGLDLLRAVAAQIRLPAFAIGGITAENLSQVLATGITRVAMSGAITNSLDPAAAARNMLSALQGGRMRK